VTDEQLRLVAPTVKLRKAYLRMLADFRVAGERFHSRQQRPARRDFAAFTAALIDQAHGLSPAQGGAPQSTYWAVVGKDVVGTIRLRHRLTESLRLEGGNVGYDVAPAWRNRGYASAMLATLKPVARQFGLERLLLTCDADNLPSARVIRKNGGVYDGQSRSSATGKMVCRYWIAL
jgi:predicted acetyltransferase